ncbi:FAD/NAD(P)-binding domain-containing protein [Apiospora kogelbergensis]|uniref:FAD/NAD(P)-binding domain-containing protein n=1 Tax=Apiospora kogelbergensis TaxID=1337665 RepID=A0AAW0R9P3_9PEZI
MNNLLYVDIDVVCLLSQVNAYDYIIVGSGFGGGSLAEALVQQKKRQLPEGNESIFDGVKAKVQCTEGSDAYIGGPIYCLGGRSNVWGIWTPEISSETLTEYFPAPIKQFLLEDGGYKRAFDLMTSGSQTEELYPLGSGHVQINELKQTQRLLQSAVHEVVDTDGFTVMPVAAEFQSSAPYKFPQGAYSTSLALMNRMFANDKYLTVLLTTEVVSVQRSTETGSTGQAESSITSLKVRSTKDRVMRDLGVGSSKVILAAGSIGTASIALNSGLHQLGVPASSLVGKGIIDHDVCYVRFDMEREVRMKKPLNLKSVVTIGGRRCLLTVTVNANFFLAGSSASTSPAQWYRDGKLVKSPLGRAAPGDNAKYDSIAVLFEFIGHLDDNNEVLSLPGKDPVLHIVRPAMGPELQAGMEDITRRIRNRFVYGDEMHQSDDPPPRPVRMGFGVFAHECGTMRMDSPRGEGVVDSDLKVKGVDNLWVCDLSVFPVSPEANPGLTLLALSLRLAKHIGGGTDDDDGQE